MTDLDQDIQRVLELIAIDKKPSPSVKQKVLERSKSKILWWNLKLPMIAVLSLILITSAGVLLYWKNTYHTGIIHPGLIARTVPQKQQSEEKGPMGSPSSMPFIHPIEIVAESYPVHPHQTFTIKPKDNNWNGNVVKLYYLEETESNDQKVMYQKVLPSNAIYVGSTVIEQGKWSFQWKAPSEVQPEGYNDFIVLAQSDEGTFSATRLPTLLYDRLEITPTTAKVGQKVELSGTGFPVGDIRVDVLQRNTPQQTTKGQILDYFGALNFQTTLGIVHSYDGSFNYSIEVTPKNHFTPGNYEVLIYYDVPGTAGAGVRVYLKVEG